MRLWLIMLLVAIAYFVAARFSLLLASGPSEASAVWPPAGIAAGAVILFGKRILFGVFLGAFVAYAMSWLDIGELQNLFGQLVLISLLSISVTIQSLVVGLLVNRFGKLNEQILSESVLLKFIFVLAPLACLTASLISNSIFLLFGVITSESLLNSFLTWWIGDTIGVVTMLPLMLATFGQSMQKHQRQLGVTFAMACVLVMIFTVFFYNKQREETSANQSFAARAELYHKELEGSFNNSLNTIYALKYFLESEDDVRKAEFNQFAEYLLEQNAHIQALEWIPLIHEWEREEFESRSDGPGRIMEIIDGGTLGVAGTKSEYFPIEFVAPLSGNERAYGFDVSSNKRAALAQQLARETGMPIASDPIRLVQEEGSQAGIVVYLPVYADGVFTGFVAMVIKVAIFIDKILTSKPAISEGIELRVHYPENSQIPIHHVGNGLEVPKSFIAPHCCPVKE